MLTEEKLLKKPYKIFKGPAFVLAEEIEKLKAPSGIA
jgi:hypothetical protein